MYVVYLVKANTSYIKNELIYIRSRVFFFILCCVPV